MILYLNVKPASKLTKIEKLSNTEYNVWLKEKPENGKANLALIKLLCKEFNTTFNKIKIKGLNSRKKTVEIIE